MLGIAALRPKDDDSANTCCTKSSHHDFQGTSLERCSMLLRACRVGGGCPRVRSSSQEDRSVERSCRYVYFYVDIHSYVDPAWRLPASRHPSSETLHPKHKPGPGLELIIIRGPKLKEILELVGGFLIITIVEWAAKPYSNH